MYYSYSSNLQLYFSVFISLLCMAALYGIGKTLVKALQCDKLFCSIFPQFQYPLIGFSFVNIFIQYYVLLIGAKKEQLLWPSYLLAFTGLLVMVFLLRRNATAHWKQVFLKKRPLRHRLIVIILSGFFLLSLAPVTNADALNYHLGVPLSILRAGKVDWQLEWFHFGLAGISENINLVSLILNAEQIPNLVQFSALLSIAGLFISKKTDISGGAALRSDLLLLLVSTPVLFFLCSSPKPQLSGLAITSLIFHFILTNTLPIARLGGKCFFLLAILLFSACATKLNFFLSATVLIVLAGFKNRDLLTSGKLAVLKFFVIAIIAAVLVFFPLLYYKAKFLCFADLTGYLFPVPGCMPGSGAFIKYLKEYTDSDFPFPLSLIVPSAFGNISMVLGLNLILLILVVVSGNFARRSFIFWILGFCILSAAAGQKTARFFFEPYVWMLLFTATQLQSINPGVRRLIRLANPALGVFTLGILTFGIFSLSQGLISLERRESVLKKNASGYNLSTWVNQVLPADTRVLIQHNSISLFRQNTYSHDWSKYISFEKGEEKFFSSYLRQEKVKYIVLVSNGSPESSVLFRFCGRLVKGPYRYHAETRNPFNSGEEFSAWIYTARF